MESEVISINANIRGTWFSAIFRGEIMSSNNVDNYGRQDNPRKTRIPETRRASEKDRRKEKDKADIVLASFERLSGVHPPTNPINVFMAGVW